MRGQPACPVLGGARASNGPRLLDLDESIVKLGVKVLKSPPRSPTANAICERVIGTIRRESLDWLVPLSEAHLRWILKSRITHYNTARLHMALGLGVPDPPTETHHNFNSRSDIACARMLPCARTPSSVVSTTRISWHQPSRC
jgi:hypothetical protein